MRWARALERTAGAEPAISRRAAAWLAELAIDEAAPSTLTADGYPVELAWSTASRALRTTVELATPGGARARLDAVDGRLGARIPARWMGRLRALQAPGALAYGAWLGGRHDAGGDRAKAYVELPPDDAAAELAADLLGHSGPHRRWPPRMLGWTDGAFELYFRARGLGRDGCADLAHLVDRSADAAAVVELAARATGAAEPFAGVAGWSVATDPRGDPTAVSWFAFSTAGRAAVLALAAERGWDLSGYAALPDAAHGLVAVTLPRRGPIALGVGVSASG